MELSIKDVDCNCNDCIFMERDKHTKQGWEYFHRNLQLDEYFNRKNKKILEVLTQEESMGHEHPWLMSKAIKYKFQFDKVGLVNYGNCTKFGKPVSFLPDTCQIETQSCFKNRRK